MATPDVEGDIVTLLATLLPADFIATGDEANIFDGPERPIGSEVNAAGTFVRLSPSSPTDERWQTGQIRRLGFQVLHRFDPERGDHRAAYRNARALAFRVFDALHASTNVDGASGTCYTAIEASTEPIHLQPRYWASNYDVTWAEERA